MIDFRRKHISEVVLKRKESEFSASLAKSPYHVYAASRLMVSNSSNLRLLHTTLWALFTLNILLVGHAISEATGLQIPAWLSAFDQIIEEMRSGVMLAEFFGTAVLFVDVVTRFDRMHPKRKWLHCIAVACCMIGFVFQFFVHFLSSSYLE